MIYLISVQTACAKQADKVLKAAQRAAEKMDLPKPTGAFSDGPVVQGPPPPPCGPGEEC